MPLGRFPNRVFLDSSTLQTLQDYGEFIYDGGAIDPENRIWSIPGGFANLEALQRITVIGSRGSIQLVLSENSLQEVKDRGRNDYIQWASEMLDYWQRCLDSYENRSSVFSGRGMSLSAQLEEKRFGYLGIKDARLIRDAVLLECDVFLTMERKLPKNAPHVEKYLEIKVLQPIGYWELLRPWAALYS